MKTICKQFGLFAAILGWTFLLSGCSLLGANKEKAQAQISVSDQLLANYDVSLIVSDGISEYEFRNENFKPRDNPTTGPATPVISTPESGNLKVKINVTLKGKETSASSGNIELPLKGEWRHSIHLITGQKGSDPTTGCYGCRDFYAFDFEGENAQSESSENMLYVILAGNFIEREMIY